MIPKIDAIDHIVLTVVDIGKSVHFYTRVLGMTDERLYPTDGSERVALNFGHQKINLHLSGNEFQPNAAYSTAGSADLCFLTQQEIPVWLEHLNDLKIGVECGPIARTGATGPLTSIYIRDPDGNLIEVSKLV